MMDYTLDSRGRVEYLEYGRELARTQIDALLRKLKGAQSASDRGKYFWELKYGLRQIFEMGYGLHPWGLFRDGFMDSELSKIVDEPLDTIVGASKFGGAQGLRFRMKALVWELKTTIESELETEIMLQVRKELRQIGQCLYESLECELNCWANSWKTGMSAANANAPLWIRRAEAEAHAKARAKVVEARRKARVEIKEMLRGVEAAADAAADAAAEEVWRRVEAPKLYTGSATATNSDLDDKMWTSILEELCKKATTFWSIATTKADELWRIADAIEDEVRRKEACLSWRATLSVAEAVWSEAGPEAEEVWRRAGAANLMKTAEEDCMQSREVMLTRLMAIEGREEEDLRKKQDEEARLVFGMSVYAVYAVALLALVYLYLVGLIDRGGTKTYSPSSRAFRSTFASIVLVLGFYIWFKFRDPATRKLARRGYRRPGQTMIEARYKPPRESGNNNYISFGTCTTDEEAGIKKEIAAFFYGRHTGWLDFEDEHPFHISPMRSEQANLSAEEKREWVKSKVMEVYEDVKRFRASIAQLGPSGSNLGHHLPNPPAEQSEHNPHVALNPEFRVADMDPSQDVDAGSSKFDVENFPESPSRVMIDLPDLLHAEPQLVQNSTLELALKLVSCLEQSIAEKDRQIAEKERQIEEQARIIVELKRERSFSQL